MKRFGIMLDCSRNAVMKPLEILNFAKTIKFFGYNTLLLYTEDTYEIENEPYFGYMRGRYTAAELKQVVDFCDSIGIEVIPCIQTLGHLDGIFRNRVYKEINDCDNILLVGEERTYELIENMFKTLAKVYSSKYVHIGMDEAFMLGLGNYRRKNGSRNRLDIFKEHLQKVSSIAQSYGFKPLIWSDMFFRIANGTYYAEEPILSDETKASIPSGVGLVYWDYYHAEREYYEKMLSAHLSAGKEVWFAGGAWSWTGFASGNRRTVETAFPAMDAVKKFNVDNVFLTLWGDNGKECSFYALLPSLFAVKKHYDGETDADKIKAEFRSLTGEDYDAMFSLDEPNFVGGNRAVACNVCKHMLYNDPFNGIFDSVVKEGVDEEYKELAKKFEKAAKKSLRYGYIFASHAALCRLLSVKYSLGVRTRKAYEKRDKEELFRIAADYKKAEKFLRIFHAAFEKLWYNENKPHGFDVQDLRLGGLKQRLVSCRARLLSYVNGEIDSIPELDEKLLCWFGDGNDFRAGTPSFNKWSENATVNSI